MISLSVRGIPELTTRMTEAQMAQAQNARRVVNRLALALRAFLRESAPVGKDKVDYNGRLLRRGGTLRKSIRFKTEGSGDLVVASFYADKVAKYVIGGTRAHDIWAGFYNGRPAKKALWWQGAKHPTPYVRHPGTAANDFRLPALRRTVQESQIVVAEEAPKFLRGL